MNKQREKKDKVLIIDDEPVLRRMVVEILGYSGYEVHEASGVDHGIEVALEIKPSIILIDVVMPEINGLEGCRRIKSIDGLKDIPVIVVTGKIDDETLRDAFDSGAHDYIAKPFRVVEMVSRIRAALKIREAEGELTSYRDHLERLVEERTRQIHELSELSMVLTGEIEAIYERVVRSIGDLFQMHLVAVSEIKGDDIYLNTVYQDGSVRRDAGHCPLSITPCSMVGQNRDVVIFDNVLEHYPDAQFIRESRARFYCGIPCLDSRGEVSAVLCILDDRSRTLNQGDIDLLKIIGRRIGMEMERNRSEQEKRLLEAQLRHAQKMETIGTLAGGIAHDFNNILTPIIAYAGLGMEEAREGTMLHQSLKSIHKAGLRAKDLVKHIMAFSRQAEHEMHSVNMRDIVAEVLKLLRPALPSFIEIQVEVQGDYLVHADPTQMHQVLMNLCTNAAHAMEENGGLLMISLNSVDASYHMGLAEGKYVRLTVGDTGHGMPQEIIDKIFDPFFTTKEVGKGTGMGLSVVHGIVKSHKGTIAVKSSPGDGTTFTIYIPEIGTEKKREETAQAEEKRWTGRILLVDDDQMVAESLGMIMESMGFTVSISNDSLDALNLIKREPNRFDLVITDRAMPMLTGEALSREIRKVSSSLPVILCTGFSDNISEKEAKEMGISGILMKPVIRKEMETLLDKVLAIKTDSMS